MLDKNTVCKNGMKEVVPPGFFTHVTQQSAQDCRKRLVRNGEQVKPSTQRIKHPTVGTRLVREYQGVEYHVTVARNGFECQGRTYCSLSHIIREITGIREL